MYLRAASILIVGIAVSLSLPAGAVEKLVLSEVLYDSEGPDGQLEWIELFNGGEVAVDLSGWSLGWGGSDYAAGSLALQGRIESGAYFVLGGPESGPANGDPTLDWAIDLSPDLQNSGEIADGVALFALPAEAITSESVPDSAVIYGEENASGLLDSTGLPGWVDVGDAPPGASLEFRGDPGWAIQLEPTPGDGPLTVPEPSARGGAAAALSALTALLRRRRRTGMPRRLRYDPAEHGRRHSCRWRVASPW